MPHEILSFRDALIKSEHYPSRHLLTGNGFSIDCRQHIFAYSALFKSAEFSGLSSKAKEAFTMLSTTDFEKVIRALQDSAQLSRLYRPQDEALASIFESDATGLREVLVNTIARSHPDLPSDISAEEYLSARSFLRHFRHIYTLNYDLLLYWTMMQDALFDEPISFDDGFRMPAGGPEDYVTWEIEKTDKQNIFYLHGALHIFDAQTEIQKFTWKNTGVRLKEQIRLALSSQRFPLIVAEGESHQKQEKILHSNLLSRGYRSFAKIGGALFIFGHSFSDNDSHILRLIQKSKLKHIFVSIFGEPDFPGNQEIIARAEHLISTSPNGLKLNFYDAQSAHVWR